MTAPRYDAVADTYTPTDDDLTRPVTRALLDLAACQPNDRALDLACGDGLITRELARTGARTTGIDLSPDSSNAAKTIEATDPLGIAYRVADAADEHGHGVEAFDLVICHFGLSDIDDLPTTLRNVSHSLVTGGRLGFSILQSLLRRRRHGVGLMASQQLLSRRAMVASHRATIDTARNAARRPAEVQVRS